MKRKLVESKSLGIMVKEELARELDALVASLPKELQQIRRKAVTAQAESLDAEKRTEVSVITTDTPDLEGDVVLPKGLDRNIFNRNPIVCLSHDMTVQVATCDWVKPTTNGLKAQTRYPQRPQWYSGDWLPDHVLACIQAGLLQGKSIGFLARNVREPLPQEISQRPEWKGARIIDDAILLEYSVCVAGINPDALVTAISKGLSPASLTALGIKTPKDRKTSIATRLESVNWERVVEDVIQRKLGMV